MSTVGHRATYRGLRPNGTTFYQSEIPLLLPPKFPSFFRKWKAPRDSDKERRRREDRAKEKRSHPAEDDERVEEKKVKGEEYDDLY